MLFMFGDTFEQPYVGGGWWRSPVALWSTTTDLSSGVKWSGAVGGAAAQQLWAYEHDNPVFSTVLPSDVITIGGSMYLHAMVNKGLGNVVWTEIWRSDNSGASWYHTGAKFDPNLDGGMFQCLTWGEGNDGYVYVYSTGFQRNTPIILKRVRSNQIANPAAYEPWGYRDGRWAWGNPAIPILTGSFGELCLRPLGGKWVLTWFNAGDYRIDGIIMDTPTSNLYTAYRQTLIYGGAWVRRTTTTSPSCTAGTSSPARPSATCTCRSASGRPMPAGPIASCSSACGVSVRARAPWCRRSRRCRSSGSRVIGRAWRQGWPGPR
jgi:hypothetical protein